MQFCFFTLVMEDKARHQCLIYDGSPSNQLPALAKMLQQKINEGYRGLYLNSPQMVAGLRSCLAAMGMDVVNEVEKSRLILSSESTSLSDGGFDGALMLRHLEDAVDQALKDGYRGLAATGDMTWEFGAERDFSKLMEYERGLEQLFQGRPELCGICQYHRDTLPPDVPRQALLTHRSLFINDTLSRVNSHYVPAGHPRELTAKDAELDEMVAAVCRG
jgi:MEDS: MEthanogen/methylotroph, DcmR Sensory domain